MTALEQLDRRLQTFMHRMGLEPDEPEAGVHTLQYDQIPILVSCFEAEGDTWVRVASLLQLHVKLSLELLQWLLRSNSQVLMGAFQLFEDHTLAFSHTLLGDEIDFVEFERTLSYVARVSSTYNEDLMELAAGTHGGALLEEDNR